MDRKSLLRNLQWNADWLKTPPKRTDDNTRRAQNLMVGCVQVINHCGQSIQGWLDRKPIRRKHLRGIATKYHQGPGSKTLRELVDLAVATLGAAVWVQDLPLGALPVKTEPKPRTEAQQAVQKFATARSAEVRRQRQEKRERARKARLLGRDG